MNGREFVKSKQVAILRADRSPMNPERWQLTMACGHEFWVSSKRKPTAKSTMCQVCAANYVARKASP